MYAIPTPGRSVPIPGTRRLLPSSGQNIGPLTQYWLRRLRDGDIRVHPGAPVSNAKVVASPAPAASVDSSAPPVTSGGPAS
jgi:hypothetical protein